MTPAETVAENVLDEIGQYFYASELKEKEGYLLSARQAIAAALERFAEEESIELVNTAVDLCNKFRALAVEEAKAEGREEALEACLKIVMESEDPTDSIEAIRALQRPAK